MFRLLLFFAFAGQLADCITTQQFLSEGKNEANPLMRRIVRRFGIPGLVVVKLGVAALLCYVAWRFGTEYRMALLLGVSGWVAAAWNYSTLLRH